jgi:ABC-2 type transport system ATP-binding protein
VVKIEGLEKKRGDFHLGPFDLRVETGAILGILGHEGSGRTTLMRLLWGFERPDKGRIEVFGMQPHLEQMRIRLRAGYASQATWWYPELTAQQFLDFIGSFYPNWDEKYVAALIKKFDITNWHLVRELSDSERRSLTTIAALGHHPSLVLLDQPMKDLDKKGYGQLTDLIMTLSRRERTTIVMSAPHSLDLDKFADGTILLNNGEVVMESSR